MRSFHHLSILLGVYLHLGSLARGELYTSTDELSRWSSIVNKTTDLLDLTIQIEEDKLAKLYEVRQLIQILDLRKINTDRIEFDVGVQNSPLKATMEHPIKAFIILNRFLKAIHLMRSTLDGDDEFEQMLADYNLPSSDDLVGCGRALLRLQTFYELDIEDVVRGNIGSNQFQDDRSQDGSIMGPSECFEIGKIAYDDEDYSMAIRWFQKSFELYNDDKLVELNDLLEYMAFAAYQNNHIRYAAELTKLWLDRDPSNDRAIYNLLYYEDELKQHRNNKMEEDEKIPNSDLMMSDDGTSSAHSNSNIRATKSSYADRYSPGTVFAYKDYNFADDDIVRRLCTRTNDDDDAAVNPENRNLTCTRRVLFGAGQYISPELKIEMINESPMVVRIYDILTEAEAKHLRQMASTKLERSTVQTRRGSLVSSDFRVAKTAWLSVGSDEIVGRLEQRIGQILDIDLSGSEDLQVVNYGVGGFYAPHLDSKRETLAAHRQQQQQQHKRKHLGESAEMEVKQVDQGVAAPEKDITTVETNSLTDNDRLATVLIYLNQVQAGGSTVFPKLNLTVRPIERSAVVWFNVMRNGYSDERTLHTGCPVLLGSKWIATKWPREAGNTFLRPCGLRSID